MAEKGRSAGRSVFAVLAVLAVLGYTGYIASLKWPQASKQHTGQLLQGTQRQPSNTSNTSVNGRDVNNIIKSLTALTDLDVTDDPEKKKKIRRIKSHYRSIPMVAFVYAALGESIAPYICISRDVFHRTAICSCGCSASFIQ
ncbi:uncharacterized protein LOC117180468 [Belonocnema kinseyi]|uniref:uncharacterized protein LOC117180468 n=1 Tax=Belonocnema kinseyi TaxID=2817044 RepID=UPI00143CF79D|nr:uncharacterized protein LOC117180468 [Belonocnema kinseyi]